MSALCLCVIFLSAAGVTSGLNTTDGSNKTSEDAMTSDPSVAVETPPQDLQISITAMATPPLREGEGEGEGAEGEAEGEAEESGDVPVHRVGLRTKRMVYNIKDHGGDQVRPRSKIWGVRYQWSSEVDQLEQWQRWWLDRHTRDQMMIRKLITPVDTKEEEDQNNPGVKRKIYEVFNISCCPILYYGQRYHQLYVNHSLESSIVCFDGSFEVGGDCVQMPPMVLLQLVATNRARVLSANFTSLFPKVDPNLATCSLELTLRYTDKESILKTYQFKDLTIFHLDAHVKGVMRNVDFLVKGKSRFSWTLKDLENVDLYLLPAACRQGDSVINPNSLISADPKTCSKTMCDQMGRRQTSSCGTMQTCNGGGSCVWDSLCSVLGPLLVDVSGCVVRVPDRCSYILLNVGSIRIDGNFRERRRSDLSFIHSITFTVSTKVFLLEQGGRLSVNGEPLVLTSAPRVYHGMEVSQRDSGITMKYTRCRKTFTLVSDGTMVQIIVKGLDQKYYWGSCRNASNLRLGPSPKNCHVSYPAPPDQSINRTAVKERCQVFLQDRFSSCHEEVHPQPFVASCVSLFSEYPEKDRVFCQLLQSYTSICNQRLQGHQGYQEIRTSSECVGASFGCQDFFCSDHEFCGTSRYGDPYCMCRAIYAKPFRASGTYTLPVHCGLNSSSISLVTCLLEETGFSPLELRLQDPSCEGQMDPLTHMLTFSYEHGRPCGAEVQSSFSQTVYKNAIVFSNSSSDVITRQQDFHVSFECVYANTKELSKLYTAVQNSVSIHSSGFRDRMVQMNLYLDQNLSRPVGPKEKIELNTKVWLEVKALEGKKNLKLLSCWSTPTPAADGPVRHHLVQKSCPNHDDGTVLVEKNGVDTSSVVSFRMFQFLGISNIIHLHCSLHVCQSPCPMVCPSATD